MANSADIFNIIAFEIGVLRYLEENDFSFSQRVAYSSVRYLVSAFCMDDGAEGLEGISKSVINRRLKVWIEKLNRVEPETAKWLSDEGLRTKLIYERMIDVGDIFEKGFDGKYCAHQPIKVDAGPGISLITGFFDASDHESAVLGYPHDAMMLSGLATVVSDNNATFPIHRRWWETDSAFLNRNLESDYGNMQFVNLNCSKWKIQTPEAWTGEPSWHDGITLAKTEDNIRTYVEEYYFAEKIGHTVYLSKITLSQAEELFLFLRSENSHAVTAYYKNLDAKHAVIQAPISFLPGCYKRIIEYICWPGPNKQDSNERIVRAELIPLVRNLLAECWVEMKEGAIGWGKWC